MKDDKQIYLEYISRKLTEIFNTPFHVVFRKCAAKENDVNCPWFRDGCFGANRMSCGGEAFLRGRLRWPDDINYKDYLEFTREFLPLFTLNSQKIDISVHRVFLHRYLEFSSVAITDRAQAAHKGSSWPIKSSYSSQFHIFIVLSATGSSIKFSSAISAVISPMHRIRAVLYRYIIKHCHYIYFKNGIYSNRGLGGLGKPR